MWPRRLSFFALSDPILQLKVIEREPKTVEDALNIAVKMEAYQASVVPPESDKGAMDHKVKHKVKSTYAVEGTEQTAPAGEDGMALIHKRLSELQAECISTREEIGRVKAQKEEAEKKAAQAAQRPRPQLTQPSPQIRRLQQDQHQIRVEAVTDINDNKEAIGVEAVEEAATKPRVTMSVISVEDRDTGPEIVRMERHLNSQRHLQLRQWPRLWTTRPSVAGLARNSGTSPSAVC